MKFTVALVWISNALIPLGIIVAGIFAGLIAERIFSTQFRKIKISRSIFNIIQDAFHGMPFFWVLLAALDIALFNMHLAPSVFAQSQKVLQILLSASFIVVLARMTGNIVTMLTHHVSTVKRSSSILVNLAKFCVYAIGLLVILQTMGISILPVLTALGIGGLAVSLALNDTLSNFFAGLHLLLSRQIRNGDFIRLDTGQEGYVTDISLHNTTIQQLTNDVVIIPNTKISSAIVVNYTYGKLPDATMLVPIEVDVDGNNDLEKLEQLSRDVALEVMQEVPGGVPNFNPLIYYKTLATNSIHFTVTLKAQSYVNHYLLRHEFIKRLKYRLDHPEAVKSQNNSAAGVPVRP